MTWTRTAGVRAVRSGQVKARMTEEVAARIEIREIILDKAAAEARYVEKYETAREFRSTPIVGLRLLERVAVSESSWNG